MNEVVSFTAMQDGTAEDYELLERIDGEEMKSFPDRATRGRSSAEPFPTERSELA